MMVSITSVFLTHPSRWFSAVGTLIAVACLALIGCSTASNSKHSGASEPLPLIQKDRAVAAFRAQRFDEAAQSFMQQARAGGRDEHRAWFNAGASYWNAGQQTQALETYEQAVAVNPLYSKGHIRLTNKYASLGRLELSKKHKQHAKTIQQVTKAMLPHWDKANQLRGRGADYDYAAATIHEACAKYYDGQGLPELAGAERKLAEQSRAAGQLAKTQAGAAERQARSEAEERAFRTEVFGSLKDLTATAANVNPAFPFEPSESAGSEVRTAVAGLGALEQGFGAYADTMQMFEGKLQAQREEIRQQGQQAQAALADPKQVQLQRSAQQRTMELQKKMETMEQQAMAYLAAEGILDENETTGNQDTLDF
ncbi:MAG: tetratricopeptide repeat protein [Nitrospira sp.]|nr:tetratricopeptide repeat protein [Nitrospira sp.]